MATKRTNRAAKPRNDVAGKIATRLATRTADIKADRDANAANIDAIQAAGNVAQLRTQMVRMQREMARMRAALLDQGRLLNLALSLDDGTAPDDPVV